MIDDFATFEKAGFLIELKTFLTLDSQARSRIKDSAEKLAKRIEEFENWLEDIKLRSEAPIADLSSEQLGHFETHIRVTLPTLNCLASENPERLNDLAEQMGDLFKSGDFPKSGGDVDTRPDALRRACLRLLRDLDGLIVDAEGQSGSIEIRAD